MSGPLFGIVPAGQPLITEPTSTPSQTSILYALPTAKPFSHLVVFLLPSVALPDHTAAAIYLATASDVAAAAQSGATPNFRFLGAIGPGKESAMFKVGSASVASSGGLMIGISVEPADAVAQRLQELAADKTAASSSQQPTTAVLAQRIIQNAFNFLASFSGTAGPGGVEVVPLRAFEDWWRKFESRVRSDPSFLEKQSD
ncbi:Protein OPI10 [Tolypocladium paradoxum]|uniref:Protein OPI10 n=1 Tax=Tolypocladium paradoxum TaxID=94208 RepID=A0A2S4L4N8_9HYPO|nr:Protein OPI10 [Tolypocladium paradoxum]